MPRVPGLRQGRLTLARVSVLRTAEYPTRVMPACPVVAPRPLTLRTFSRAPKGIWMIRTIVCRAVLAGAATAAVATVVACGGTDGGHHSAGSGHGATTAPSSVAGSAPVGAAFNDADVTFAQMMIVHHRQAVEMAAMTQGRAGDAEVKALAGTIEAAQGPEIATMTGWLSTWGGPTAAPDGGGHGSAHQSMPGMMSDADLTTLKAASGAAFDKQFCTMMIAHHQGAVTMATEHIAKGSNAEAKALAQKIVADQEAEIATMNTILARL